MKSHDCFAKTMIQCPVIASLPPETVLSVGGRLRIYPGPGLRKLCAMDVSVGRKRLGDIVACQGNGFTLAVAIETSGSSRGSKFAPESWVAFPDQTLHLRSSICRACLIHHACVLRFDSTVCLQAQDLCPPAASSPGRVPPFLTTKARAQ